MSNASDATSNGAVLDRLFGVIEKRKGGDPEESYTARMMERGREHIVKKMAEESAEVVIAYLGETAEDTARESADLFYHLLVLWADKGVKPEDVWKILEEREGTSGLEEKRKRKHGMGL